MSKPATGNDYFALMERSLLLDAENLGNIRTNLAEHISNGAEQFAQTLVRKSFITPYQGRQLLNGKHRGFYLDGKYKLLEMLGSGGMGKVFLAEQISMHRLVAIKIVRRTYKNEDQKKEMLGRFTREARAVAALQHPNIIHAYDFDQDEGIPYIVMEFVEGIDAAQHVIKFGPLHPSQAADYGVQAAKALHHAHKAGMVHRDVKPQNLLINTAGDVKLLDLGLCVVFEGVQDDSLTVNDNQLGTVDYIAPEQALDSHNVTPQADIYSLGATLYTLISGKVLFSGKTTPQKLILCQTTEPPHITTHVPKLPKEMADIIHAMLDKKPENRPASMEEVEKLLTPYAQKKVPPYDISVVKYTHKSLSSFLGRSPNSDSLSGMNLTSELEPKSDVAKNGTTKNAKLGASSMISISENTPRQDDLFLSQLEKLDKASTPSLHKPKSGSSKRVSKKTKAQKDAEATRNVFTIIAASLALIVAILGIGINVYLNYPSDKLKLATTANNPANKKPDLQKTNASTQTKSNNNQTNKKPAVKNNSSPQKPKPENKPAETLAANTTASTPANTTPKVEPVATPAPSPVVKTLSALELWKQECQLHLDDPFLLLGYTFSDNKAPQSKSQGKNKPNIFLLKNETTDSSRKDIEIGVSGKWASGRFPTKGGIELKGGKEEQGILIKSESVGSLQDLPDGFSILVWLKAKPGITEDQTIVNRMANHWRLEISSKTGGLNWSMHKIGTVKYSNSTGQRKITDNQWHQIAITYLPIADTNDTNVKVYIDGVEDISHTGIKVKTSQASDLAFGYPLERDINVLSGIIDEFLVYGRALKLDEIEQHFKSGRPE
jgi:serine/threonine protein kinase